MFWCICLEILNWIQLAFSLSPPSLFSWIHPKELFVGVRKSLHGTPQLLNQPAEDGNHRPVCSFTVAVLTEVPEYVQPPVFWTGLTDKLCSLSPLAKAWIHSLALLPSRNSWVQKNGFRLLQSQALQQQWRSSLDRFSLVQWITTKIFIMSVLSIIQLILGCAWETITRVFI